MYYFACKTNEGFLHEVIIVQLLGHLHLKICYFHIYIYREYCYSAFGMQLNMQNILPFYSNI